MAAQTLSTLVELAYHDSGDRRRELLREVSNLFVEGADRHTIREIVLFGEILGRLLEKAPLDDRIAVANQVAPLERTPRRVALLLANDEFVVASPVLEQSPALTDADLLKVICTRGDQHRVAIARRPTLTELITDVLIERGNMEVLITLTENQGACISEDGFLGLAGKVTENTALGEALSLRSELPAHIAKRIVAVLSSKARGRLDWLLHRDKEQATQIVRHAVGEMSASREKFRRNRLETKVIVSDLQKGKRRIDPVVDDLVFQGRMVDLAGLLAELVSLPEAHVSNALIREDSTAIAFVCRSLDISETTYGRLAQLRCERLGMHTALAAAMVQEYATLTRSMSDRALRFHKLAIRSKAH